MTAGNSTPLTDGASAVLLGSDEWAAEHELPVLAHLVDAETAAVDYVHGGEGLLMAPVYAMPRMLARNGLTLQDFDFYEIHEAFASTVLATLEAWEDPAFCKEQLGLDAPLGSIDRSKLNVNGSSLAAGHPFAATGGRIVATLAKHAAREGPRQARPDLHLRRRRPGRRRHPRVLTHPVLPLSAPRSLRRGADSRRPDERNRTDERLVPRLRELRLRHDHHQAARACRARPAAPLRAGRAAAARPGGRSARRARGGSRRPGRRAHGRRRDRRSPVTATAADGGKLAAVVLDATGLHRPGRPRRGAAVPHPGGQAARPQRAGCSCSATRRRSRRAPARPRRARRWTGWSGPSARSCARGAPRTCCSCPSAPRPRSPRRCGSSSPAGRPTSTGRSSTRRRGATCPTRGEDPDARRWPARSPSSPAPRAASARPSPRCSPATARTSSPSTSRAGRGARPGRQPDRRHARCSSTSPPPTPPSG